MAYFINNTRRAVTVGKYLFIPGKSVVVNDASELKKLYPQFAAMVEHGEISELSKTAAKKQESAFEARSLEQLKAKAKEKGINVTGMTKAQIDEALATAGE